MLLVRRTRSSSGGRYRRWRVELKEPARRGAKEERRSIPALDKAARSERTWMDGSVDGQQMTRESERGREARGRARTQDTTLSPTPPPTLGPTAML